MGLARLGSYIGHGSGEIMFAFSTANVLENRSGKEIIDIRILKEDKLDEVFRAVAECEEEAVLNSMVASEQVVGIRGRKRESLKDFITHLL